MIARRWHGRVPAAKSEEYLALMRDVALPDYRGTPGNRGAWCLDRAEGDIVHVEMFTLWEDEDAIRRFGGDDITVAKYYDFDRDFLLEMEPGVVQLAGQGRGRVNEAGRRSLPLRPDRRG